MVLAGSAILAASVIATAAAVGSDRPTISGDPIVGHTLTSSPGETGQALYKWQSCDPGLADCSDALEHNDPNWTDLTGESHTGLSYTPPLSDLGHFVRVLIHDNDTGDHWTASVPVGPIGLEAPIAAPQPVTPEHGILVLGKPVKGNVKVKPPGGKGFVPIDDLTKLPVDTVIDTRDSEVNLTAAVGDYGNTTPDNSVNFYGGLFKITQTPDPNSPAVAKLVQKLSCGASKAKASAAGGPVAVAARKKGSKLWGSGHGGYATSGGGGTGSVRGTTWFTKETCKGTLFRVLEGLGITVNDFDLKTQVELGPGQAYFAKNR